MTIVTFNWKPIILNVFSIMCKEARYTVFKIKGLPKQLLCPLCASKLFLDSVMESESETRAQQHSRQTLIP